MGTTAPGFHLLDFGCLGDALQILLEQQDFGVFLLQNGDQVVQESDISVTTQKYREPHLAGVNVSNVQYIAFII